MVRYVGNGHYCYSNSLQMCLLASSKAPEQVPLPGFIECLTLMPFGDSFLKVGDTELMFFNPPSVSPEVGLEHALEVLGWHPETWWGSHAGEAEERLHEGLKWGPVLCGPLHWGYLSYDPTHSGSATGDHYVVALAITGGNVRLHDPGGFPYAVIPMRSFLQAWRGEHIPYRRGAFTMRYNFRQIRHVRREDMLAETLRHVGGDAEACTRHDKGRSWRSR